MKALKLFYLIIKLYFVYYACMMIYKLLGEDSIPLFVSGGLCVVIAFIMFYVKIKEG